MLKIRPTLKKRLAQFNSAQHSGEVMASQLKGAERLHNSKKRAATTATPSEEALAAMRGSPRIQGVPTAVVKKFITQGRR